MVLQTFTSETLIISMTFDSILEVFIRQYKINAAGRWPGNEATSNAC